MSINKKISTTAQNYANSLIKVVQDGFMTYEAILEDLNKIKSIVASSQELVTVMDNPAISIQTKDEIINSVFSSQVDEKLINFLKVLIDKKRFYELNEIIEAYSIKVDEIQNVKRVEIISAVEVSDEQKQRLIEKLQNKLQKTVIADWEVNKEIIGGLVIKIDDDVIDNSLKNKLENLSKNIV